MLRAPRGSLRGPTFFFGILFITEVLVLVFGVDYCMSRTAYSGDHGEWADGFPDAARGAVPGVDRDGGRRSPSSSTFFGAVLAVAQDVLALRLA